MSDYIKIKIDDYKPHPMNSNTHPQEQITELGNSLERFGQYKNVVVWGEYIIAGHGVVETARLNGLTELDAKDYSHLSQEDAVALMESDNQTPKLSIIDPVKQAEALASLSANPPGFDDLAMAEAKATLERAADELMGEVVPSLDELADEYGEPQERDFWPWIKVQVSPEVKNRFDDLMSKASGEDDSEKLDAILGGQE